MINWDTGNLFLKIMMKKILKKSKMSIENILTSRMTEAFCKNSDHSSENGEERWVMIIFGAKFQHQRYRFTVWTSLTEQTLIIPNVLGRNVDVFAIKLRWKITDLLWCALRLPNRRGVLQEKLSLLYQLSFQIELRRQDMIHSPDLRKLRPESNQCWCGVQHDCEELE